jgi:hypothetical protein
MIQSMTDVKSLDEVRLARNGEATIRRLRWLDDRLYWVGNFKRSEFATQYGISDAQASGDIATYLGNSRSPPVLDRRSGLHVAPSNFVPLFDAEEKTLAPWLRGDGQSSRGLNFVETTLPEPLINPSLLGPLLMAPETRTPVRISYQSMTTGQPSVRIISPHTIVRASRRFHVRAWDSLRKTFSDFSLARITASETALDEAWIPVDADNEWNEFVEIVLVPNPTLSPAQIKMVQQEYSMERGKLAIRTRRALAIYAMIEIGIIDLVRQPSANTSGKLLLPEDAKTLRKLVFGREP